MTVANVMQMCTAIEFDSIELELNMKWILSIECSGQQAKELFLSSWFTSEQLGNSKFSHNRHRKYVK